MINEEEEQAVEINGEPEESGESGESGESSALAPVPTTVDKKPQKNNPAPSAPASTPSASETPTPTEPDPVPVDPTPESSPQSQPEEDLNEPSDSCIDDGLVY